MRKFLLSALAFSLCAGSVSAQAFQWANGYTNQMTAPEVASSGNSVVSLGLFTGMMQVNNQTFITQDSADSYIIKHDLYGNPIWAKHFVDNGFYNMNALTTDADQNIFVAGTVQDSVTIDNTTIKNPVGQSGAIVMVKFNAGGSLLWWDVVSIGNAGYGYVTGLATEPNGNIYITGSFGGNVTFGSTMLTASGSSDIFVVKYDPAGTVLWAQRGGSSSSDMSSDIAVTPSGDAYIAGTVNGSNGQFGSHTVGQGLFLAKYNSAGVAQSVQGIATGSGNNNMMAIALDTAQNVFVTGTFGASATFGSHVLSGSSSGVNSFLAKSDATGNWLWADKMESSSNRVIAQDVHVNKLGDVFISGDMRGTVSFDNIAVTGPTSGGGISFITKYNGAGAAQWAQAVTTNSANHSNAAQSLTSDASGNVYVSGSFNGDATFGSITRSANWGGAYLTKIMDGASTVTGTVFIDANGNGTKDSGESGFEDVLVEAASGPLYTNSGADGNYAANLGIGNYTLSLPVVPDYYTATPATHTAAFTALGQSAGNKDFALVPTPNMNDIQVAITNVTAARPGFTLQYQITLKNVGTTTLSDSVMFEFDNSALTFASASVTPTAQSGNQLKWLYQNLQPNEKNTINLSFTVSANTVLGTALNANVAARPFTGDQLLTNNYDTLNNIVVGSFDPNDKQVKQEEITPAQAAAGKYLDYTVRFQNTGTDSAFTVMILDSLSGNVQVGTMQVLAASHNYKMFVRENGIVEWRFDNILLPDSNRNEPASHGFVRYRVRTQQTLQHGDEVRNSAAIYFDFNEPVITNTAVTRVMNPTGINKNLVKNLRQLYLYPNPASESIVIEAELEKAQPVTLHLRNLLGQELQTVELGEQQNVMHQLNVQHLAKGIYLLQLQAGAETVTQRVVIK